jgi:membrane-associated phospholipid phosphatase
MNLKGLLIVPVVVFSIVNGFCQTDTTRVMWNSIPDTSVNKETDVAITKATSGQVYKVKNGIDIPLTIAAAGYTLYGFSVVYNRGKTPESVILALNPDNVNQLDRRVTHYYSPSAKAASDYFFYGSMPLPLVLLIDKKIRKDAAKVGLLYVQALSVTGSLYVTSSMLANRFRPYTYNTAVDMDKRTGGGGKNSFFAGHPSIVTTSTFFMAKVISDYHPEMKNKWILYAVAGSASLATGLLRIKAGEHFITDVMVGIPVGAMVGILVPQIHKNKKRNSSFTLLPTYNQHQPGFYMAWSPK